MRIYMLCVVYLSCLSSCHPKQSSKEKGRSQKTIITGKLINYHPKGIDVQQIDPYDFNLITLKPTEFRYIQGADSFYMTFELDRPTEMIMWFKNMYVSPGDSVHLVYDVKENTKYKRIDTLYASGKNSANYDFFGNAVKKARAKLLSVYAENKDASHIERLKKNSKKVYLDIVQSLDRQAKDNNITLDALNYLKKKVFGIYIANLAIPFGKITPDHIPSDYLADIDPRILSDSLLLVAGGTAMEQFLFSLSQIKPGIAPYSPTHFKHSLELIKEHSKGFNRDFLFYATVNQFTKNRNWQFTGEMEAAYNQMLSTVVDSVCKQHIIQLGFNPNEAIFRASKTLKAIQLRDEHGKQTTLGDMIDQHLHHVIYIDIWASWCRPCRAEMPYARNVRKTYQDKPVSFVYLSIDKDKESWMKAVGEEQLQDITANYVLKNPGDFGMLRKEFKFTGIPHYVLIGPKGNVAFVNAPRPSSDQLQTTLDNLLRSTDKVQPSSPPPRGL
jgi:thiol-disulfide isomerase/thioredoxin